MKVTIVKCDLCHKELKEAALTIDNMDFCEVCAPEIIQRVRRYTEATYRSDTAREELATEPQELATEPQEVEKVEGPKPVECVKPEMLSTAHELVEKLKESQKPKKETKSAPIDWDRACYLKKSGWKNRDIAVELNIKFDTLNACIYKKMAEYEKRKAREEAERQERIRRGEV